MWKAIMAYQARKRAERRARIDARLQARHARNRAMIQQLAEEMDEALRQGGVHDDAVLEAARGLEIVAKLYPDEETAKHLKLIQDTLG